MRSGKCFPAFAAVTRSRADGCNSLGGVATALRRRADPRLETARQLQLIAVAGRETSASGVGKQKAPAAGSDQVTQQSCCNPQLT